MFRRWAPAVALLALVAVSAWSSAPARAARTGSSSHDILSGTWSVARRCTTGCNRSQTVTLLVQPAAHGTYRALGPGVHYEILAVGSGKFIVHARKASSLLTVNKAGKSMTALGVGDQGETFVSMWTCVQGANKSSGAKAVCGGK